MAVKEDTNRNKIGAPERRDSGEGPDEAPLQKIIDFESGRKTLERPQLKKEQIHARLAERRRLPGLASHWRSF